MTEGLRAISRTRVLSLFLMVAVFLFLAQLFYLQVVRHGHYVAQANAEQLKSLQIPAKRGEIYAMSHDQVVPLVMNQVVYTVFADPKTVERPDEIVKAVKEVAGGSARPNLAELVRMPDSRYQILAKKITRRQAEALKKRDLKGLGFQEESQRVYAEGNLAAQVVGFVNSDNVGNYGIEGALNDRLSGKDGMLRTVTDVRDVPLTIGSQNIMTPPEDGENLVLTLDRQVQNHTEQALKKGLEKAGATEGSALVMNPKNGQVLAMANYPSYSPANFGNAKSASLFNNAIISDPYEPASVIKTFTMATGIDEGVINPQSTYINNDSTRVADITVVNALRGLTGTRTMQEVLDYSLNTGTVTVARRLGDGQNINRQARDTMYDYFYNRFGLGQLTGVELANESAGLLVSPKEEQGNEVRYSNMTFGQGLDVTMLQVATGFSAVINGGTYYPPSILAGTIQDGQFVSANRKAETHRAIKASTSKDVRRMLMNARRSVSWMKDADKKGYMIGGKTGTAETLKNGRYVKSETVGTYLGFGGQKDDPDYVIMVRVAAPNRNLEGGIHASPIFADISNWMLDYLRIPPKGN